MKLYSILLLSAIIFSIHAQAEVHDKSLKSYKLPPNLKKYFQDKYKDQIDKDSPTSKLQETPHGPRGTLHVSGNFRVKNIEALPEDKADRARAIAKVFLRDEAELLGLPDLNELREYKISTSKGHDGEYTSIYYRRYIDGLPLEKSWAHIAIGPDESIVLMNISLVPASPELYTAVTNKTITEEEALRIIKKDARAKNVDEKRFKAKIKIYAISSSPYVVWKGRVSMVGGRYWKYVVNAFTGEIISVRKFTKNCHTI